LAKVREGQGSNVDADTMTVFDNDLEDGLRGHTIARDALALVDRAQQPAAGDGHGTYPGIDRQLGPGRHRHGPHALAFANQVDQHPARVTLLDIGELKPGHLFAPQATAEKPAQQRAIALAFMRARSGSDSICSAWVRVSQFPVRIPWRLAPLTLPIAQAVSGARIPLSAASTGACALRLSEH
jgi:hypothetical protein